MIATVSKYMIATVSKYPNPDDNIRSNSLSSSDGGNCANTLLALVRLGLDTVMATKLGDDTSGLVVTKELEENGVGTRLCFKKKGSHILTVLHTNLQHVCSLRP